MTPFAPGDADVLVPLVAGPSSPGDREDDQLLASPAELVVQHVQVLQGGLQHLRVVRPRPEDVTVAEVVAGNRVVILLGDVVQLE